MMKWRALFVVKVNEEGKIDSVFLFRYGDCFD